MLVIADKKRAVSVWAVVDATCLSVASRFFKDFVGVDEDGAGCWCGWLQFAN